MVVILMVGSKVVYMMRNLDNTFLSTVVSSWIRISGLVVLVEQCSQRIKKVFGQIKRAEIALANEMLRSQI